MRIFVALCLICWAAEGLAAEGPNAEEDSLSLLQTRMGVNESDEADLAAPTADNNLDRALEGKGTPRRRRRSRRRRTRRRRTPSPTPAPTANCKMNINQFKGEKFSVTQQSTYHSLLQTHLAVNDSAEVHRQLTALGVNASEVHRNLDRALEGKGTPPRTPPTYTYDITIGGEIHQKTSDAGDYFIGTHVSPFGDMIEYFRNGAKCGSTPRQADVTYIVGATMQLMSAQETSMCVYKFTIMLPESMCHLPATPLDDLDTNNEDGENEMEEELQAEEVGQTDCKKWCNSKKHKNKCWHQGPDGCPNMAAPGEEPYKCKWMDCADCDECK